MSTISTSMSYIQSILSYQQAAGRKSISAESAQITFEVSEEIGEAEDKQQTLEEFKQEFYKFIDSVPIHPSQAGARHSVSIHDKAFEKMMNDPEFKAEVEGLIRREFSGDFSIASPAFCTMRFDENGVYTGTAGGSAHMGKFETEAADAFWRKEPAAGTQNVDQDSFWKRDSKKSAKEKAKEKREEMDKLLERLAEKRQQHADILQENYLKQFHPGYYGSTVKHAVTQPVSLLDGLI